MTTKTLTIRNALAGNFLEVSEGSAGAEISTATKFSVGTTSANQFGYLIAQGDQTVFDTPGLPTADVPGSSTGDSFRTLNTYTGTFAAGNWTIQPRFISNDPSGTGDGLIGMRVFRGTNADGSGATEITTGIVNGSAVTNLTSSASQNSTITWAAPAITLENEYLFFRAAWRISGAGRVSSVEHIVRGEGASNFLTTDFLSSVTASPSTGQSRLVGKVPVVIIGTALPLVGRVHVVGNVPTVELASKNVPGRISVVGNAPVVELGFLPGVGQIRMAGNAPAVSVTAFPDVGRMRMAGNLPTVDSATVGGTWHQVPSANTTTWGKSPLSF